LAETPLTLRELAEIPVTRLKGVGDKREAALGKLEIESILDLLMFYPRRWVDRTREARIDDLVAGEECLVIGEVRSVNKRLTKSRRTMVNVVIGDGSGRLSISFFNQPWRERQLSPGMNIAVFGNPDVFRGQLQMTNPIVDLIGDRTGRIVPIYPQSEKVDLQTWEIASFVQSALERCRPRGIADSLRDDLREAAGVIARFEAMENIHTPQTLEMRSRARESLAFDEVFRVQTVLIARKRALALQSIGIEHSRGQDAAGDLVARFVDSLPFKPTSAQDRVIGEIGVDLSNPQPMHRLLQGDVGSGKTVVAVAAMLTAVQGGYQAAIMAPTEVLAEQHSLGIKNLLAGFTVLDPATLTGERNLTVELLTGSLAAGEKRRIVAGIAEGSVDIAIGTHALIQDAVGFKRLGVVVVDEQHRFGVEQRAALRDKGAEIDGRRSTPDVLVMTATPIPRTAAMTVYGDLDVSILDELPPGRTPIVTKWANGAKDQELPWEDVRDAVGNGQQAYVVCPLIEESEKLEAASAEQTLVTLQAGELKGLRLALLHGRMHPAEKDAVMSAFRRGETDVLVATTVIEVGVDVPNATVMVILDADRFGIAQLHQLRGRVGRGSIASTCWLVTTEELDTSPRIESLVASTDGFVLAEVDLDIRGEGTLMSTAQKGENDLRLASLRTDRELIERARHIAQSLVDADPLLKQHSQLRDEINLLLSPDDLEYLFKS
jgi:ATP-dependent DNA helicase RecG